MAKAILISEQIVFIKQNRLIMCGRDIERKFGIPRGKVTRWLRENGLSIPLALQKRFRASGNIGKTSATPEEDQFITDNYLTMPVKRIGKNINRSGLFVSTRMRQLELITPRHIVEQFIAESKLKKGNVPPNKGKKMSKRMYAKAKLTMFKKGHLPVNTLHDGAISIRKDKRGVPYKHIRIALGKWIYLHIHTYEKSFGKIPKGGVIRFRDRDTLNCDPANLILIDKAENMKLNTIHRYPDEIKQAIRAVTKLKKTINGKEQND